MHTGMYCVCLSLHQVHWYAIAVNLRCKFMTICCQNTCLASGHHHIVTLQVEESDPSDFEFEDEDPEGKQALLESDEEELSPDDDDESGACVRLYARPTLICACCMCLQQHALRAHAACLDTQILGWCCSVSMLSIAIAELLFAFWHTQPVMMLMRGMYH